MSEAIRSLSTPDHVDTRIGAQDFKHGLPTPETGAKVVETIDCASLFLTANADTVHSLSVVDLSKGPMVIDQPCDYSVSRFA